MSGWDPRAGISPEKQCFKSKYLPTTHQVSARYNCIECEILAEVLFSRHSNSLTETSTSCQLYSYYPNQSIQQLTSNNILVSVVSLY